MSSTGNLISKHGQNVENKIYAISKILLQVKDLYTQPISSTTLVL